MKEKEIEFRRPTVLANRDLIGGFMYILTLNFEIPQVAYFQSFYAKIVIFLALHHVTF